MAVPRWKTILEKALSKNPKQTTFQLATLDSDASRFSADTVPRVRSHIFRKFLTSPDAAASPLLSGSTDIRSAKVTQLTQTSTKAELAWWLEDSVQQVRIICDVYLVASPDHPLREQFHKALRNAPIGSGLAALRDNDWEADRVELFLSMSPWMKATWCRPPPGSKLQGGQDESNSWPRELQDPKDIPNKASPEYKEAQHLWKLALSNFATVVIDPLEVDFIDLGVIPNVRFVFRRAINSQVVTWEEEELVP